MKKMVTLIAVAAVFAACGNKQNTQAVIVDSAAIQRNAIAAEQARIIEEQRIKDSIKTVVMKEESAKAAVVKQSNNNVVKRRTTTSRSNNTGTSETPSSSGSGSEESVAPAKKGWSDAAKGTVIGAGAGGIAGAIIDKGKGRGAIIGGAVGAGTGYIIGRAKDRKTGRVVKKTDN